MTSLTSTPAIATLPADATAMPPPTVGGAPDAIKDRKRKRMRNEKWDSYINKMLRRAQEACAPGPDGKKIKFTISKRCMKILNSMVDFHFSNYIKEIRSLREVSGRSTLHEDDILQSSKLILCTDKNLDIYNSGVQAAKLAVQRFKGEKVGIEKPHKVRAVSVKAMDSASGASKKKSRKNRGIAKAKVMKKPTTKRSSGDKSRKSKKATDKSTATTTSTDKKTVSRKKRTSS